MRQFLMHGAKLFCRNHILYTHIFSIVLQSLPKSNASFWNHYHSDQQEDEDDGEVNEE